jgi:hypothetical protein
MAEGCKGPGHSSSHAGQIKILYNPCNVQHMSKRLPRPPMSLGFHFTSPIELKIHPGSLGYIEVGFEQEKKTEIVPRV